MERIKIIGFFVTQNGQFYRFVVMQNLTPTPKTVELAREACHTGIINNTRTGTFTSETISHKFGIASTCEIGI